MKTERKRGLYERPEGFISVQLYKTVIIPFIAWSTIFKSKQMFNIIFSFVLVFKRFEIVAFFASYDVHSKHTKE